MNTGPQFINSMLKGYTLHSGPLDTQTDDNIKYSFRY